MTLEAVARRPLVPRPRRRQRPSLGPRPGDQAPHPARDHRPADDVVRGRVERAVPAEAEVDGGTLITLHHTALGLFPDGYREALSQGLAAHARARRSRGRGPEPDAHHKEDEPMATDRRHVAGARTGSRRRRGACSSGFRRSAWPGGRMPRHGRSASSRCTSRPCRAASPASPASVPGAGPAVQRRPAVRRRAAELLPALDQSIANAKQALGGMDDAALTGDVAIDARRPRTVRVPRGAFLRSIMLNHWYHHRGQLTVFSASSASRSRRFTGRAPTRTRSPEGRPGPRYGRAVDPAMLVRRHGKEDETMRFLMMVKADADYEAGRPPIPG